MQAQLWEPQHCVSQGSGSGRKGKILCVRTIKNSKNVLFHWLMQAAGLGWSSRAPYPTVPTKANAFPVAGQHEITSGGGSGFVLCLWGSNPAPPASTRAPRASPRAPALPPRLRASPRAPGGSELRRIWGRAAVSHAHILFSKRSSWERKHR